MLTSFIKHFFIEHILIHYLACKHSPELWLQSFKNNLEKDKSSHFNHFALLNIPQMPLRFYFVLESFNVFLCKIVFLLSIWKKLTLELCVVKDLLRVYPSSIPWSASHILNNLQRFSKVTIKFSYSMVTFVFLWYVM